MSECPVPPALDPNSSDVQGELPSILAKMKIPTCKEAGGGTEIAFGLAKAGVSGSVGCDQIALVASKFLQTQNVLTCIMNKHRQTQSMNVVGIQHINWNLNHTHLKCKNIIINQNMKIDVYEEGKFTTSVKQEMSDKLVDMIHEMINSSQKTKTSGWMKSAQGNKSFTDAVTQINEQITSKEMSEVVQESLNGIQARQEIVLDWKGSDIDADNCEINQTVLLRTAVNNMMSGAIDQAMSLDKVTDFFQDLADHQDTSTDTATNSSMFIIAAIVLVVVLLGSGFLGSFFKYLIPILIIVDIVFLIIYATKKKWVLTGIFGAGLVVLLIAEVVSVASSKKKKPGLGGIMPNIQQYQQYQPQQSYMPGVYAPMYSPPPPPPPSLRSVPIPASPPSP